MIPFLYINGINTITFIRYYVRKNMYIIIYLYILSEGNVREGQKVYQIAGKDKGWKKI